VNRPTQSGVKYSQELWRALNERVTWVIKDALDPPIRTAEVLANDTIVAVISVLEEFGKSWVDEGSAIATSGKAMAIAAAVLKESPSDGEERKQEDSVCDPPE